MFAHTCTYMYMHTRLQGSILPDGGNSQFIISGDHQSLLTVVNFTEALDGTHIECHIAFHGNIPIAQFTLLLPGLHTSTAVQYLHTLW